MSGLKIVCGGLTDTEMAEKLGALSPEMKYRNVSLESNALQRLPDFGLYQQFNRMVEITLWKNQITKLNGTKLPVTIETVNIWDNKIIEIVELSIHLNLTKLDISANQLLEIDPAAFPVSIEILDLSHNKLTHIGDFSQHTNLKSLDLVGNNISSIHPSNKVFSGWVISHLNEDFFITDEGHSRLIAGVLQSEAKIPLQIEKMEQPPCDIFMGGYQAVLKYFGKR